MYLKLYRRSFVWMYLLSLTLCWFPFPLVALPDLFYSMLPFASNPLYWIDCDVWFDPLNSYTLSMYCTHCSFSFSIWNSLVSWRNTWTFFLAIYSIAFHFSFVAIVYFFIIAASVNRDHLYLIRFRIQFISQWCTVMPWYWIVKLG